jgi:DNA helicase-2/ATP-dependent DNA helicase PcrA
VTKDDRPVILRKMLADEGNLGFDLFAEVVADLLEQSPRLCRLISDCYPTIVLDEFQDTNRDEWRMIAALGRHSRLIALADAEQRIYEFRGADPARIGEFIEAFKPTIFDFGKENNRSDGTDITDFGNDLLTGANVGKTYQQVKVVTYGYDAGEPLSSVKYQTLAAMRRLINNGRQDWSLAILVKSKDMMLKVSIYLNITSARLPAVQHDVLIDPEGPALTAVLLSGLLEGAADSDGLAKSLLSDVVNHMRGRQGGRISQADLGLAEALSNYLGGASLKGKNRLALIADISMIAERRMELQLSGDPEADWIAVRDLVDAAQHPKLKAISEDARFIRLLNRGAVLRETLSERWRISGGYSGARRIVADALLQEHFSAATRVWTGVNVMTVHKAKGKEFDEVIVFEGAHSDRLLRENPTERDTEQARLALRVAVTRARTRTALLTPDWKRCPLLC